MVNHIVERAIEHTIITNIRKNHGYAVHIDCCTDGFPDLFIIIKRKVIQLEVKVAEPSEKLMSVMEITQAPVLRAMSKAGHKNLWLCVFSAKSKILFLYGIDTMIDTIIDQGRISDLELHSWSKPADIFSTLDHISE